MTSCLFIFAEIIFVFWRETAKSMKFTALKNFALYSMSCAHLSWSSSCSEYLETCDWPTCHCLALQSMKPPRLIIIIGLPSIIVVLQTLYCRVCYIVFIVANEATFLCSYYSEELIYCMTSIVCLTFHGNHCLFCYSSGRYVVCSIAYIFWFMCANYNRRCRYMYVY